MSTLFTTSTIGFPDFCSIVQTSWSAAVIPSRISVIKIITFAISIASSACILICSKIISFEYGSIPPVSIIVKVFPHHSPSAKIRSRVTPGVSSTIDMRFPAILLNNVDFPTFGLPTMAIMGFDIYFAPFFLQYRKLSVFIT